MSEKAALRPDHGHAHAHAHAHTHTHTHAHTDTQAHAPQGEEACCGGGVAGLSGGGEAAADLKPPPAVLTGMYDRPMIGMGQSGPGAHMAHGKQHHHPGLSHAEAMGGVNIDAYNFWAVSEGGEPLGSSMPAFKEILSEQERWQTLLYIINGLSSKTGE